MLAHYSWEQQSKFDLKFKPPLAYRGVQLLSAYDEAVRNAILLYRIGVYSAADYAEWLRLAAKCVRAAYASVRVAIALEIRIGKYPSPPEYGRPPH